MPTDQAVSLCTQTKLDELNHDKGTYSVPTGFWDQGYWGERSAESIKIIQKVNDELNHDKDTYSVPTGFWDQGYWGERSAESIKKMHDSTPARCRHGSRGRKVREPLLHAPFCSVSSAFRHDPRDTTPPLVLPALEQS